MYTTSWYRSTSKQILQLSAPIAELFFNTFAIWPPSFPYFEFMRKFREMWTLYHLCVNLKTDNLTSIFSPPREYFSICATSFSSIMADYYSIIYRGAKSWQLKKDTPPADNLCTRGGGIWTNERWGLIEGNIRWLVAAIFMYLKVPHPKLEEPR